MSWLGFARGSEFLLNLFPRSPSLDNVRIIEIRLHDDGPRVTIRLDLSEFPEHPPRKWVQSVANTVQIELIGIGIRGLEIHGWCTTNIAAMQISSGAVDGVQVDARGNGFHLKADLEYLFVDSVSAYVNTAKR